MTATAPAPAEVVHTYQPQGGCRDLWMCRDDEVLISGPAGTGKSRAALEKVHAVMLANPGARALIVRQRAVDLPSSAIATWEGDVIVEALETGMVIYFGGSSREPPGYRYSNGSRVNIGGLDKPTKIMSTEYDLIYVCEAIELTENGWESCSIRLRHGRVSFQQLMADTNPDTPTHWLNQRCQRGATRLIESRHEDNPTVCNPDGSYTERGAAYVARLDALTGVRLNRYRHGLWVAAEGVIWDGFDPAVHVIDRFEIPASWPRDLSIDWGFTNPMVVQWWAEDPDGRLFLYRELYRTRLLAAEAGEIVARYPERIRRAVADHDSGDREAFRRASGIRTHPAHKDVNVGLETVADRWKPAGDGRARLFLLKGSLISADPDLVERKLPTCTEQEIPGYVWDRSSAAKREKEAPVKDNDHGCDAMRYEMMERRRRRLTKVGAA